MLQLKFHLFSFYFLPIWYIMTFAVTIISTKFFSTSGTPKLHYSYSSFSNTKVLILNLSSTILKNFLNLWLKSQQWLKQISLQPLDGKPDTSLLLHSHFTHANFAIMTNIVICWILASARTSTNIIVHYLPSVEVEYNICSPLSRQVHFGSHTVYHSRYFQIRCKLILLSFCEAIVERLN